MLRGAYARDVEVDVRATLHGRACLRLLSALPAARLPGSGVPTHCTVLCACLTHCDHAQSTVQL